jgi:hypothetical protein
MFYIELQTKRFLRKPLREGFLNLANSEAELRRIVLKNRPKAHIVYLLDVVAVKELMFKCPDCGLHVKSVRPIGGNNI